MGKALKRIGQMKVILKGKMIIQCKRNLMVEWKNFQNLGCYWKGREMVGYPGAQFTARCKSWQYLQCWRILENIGKFHGYHRKHRNEKYNGKQWISGGASHRNICNTDSVDGKHREQEHIVRQTICWYCQRLAVLNGDITIFSFWTRC